MNRKEEKRQQQAAHAAEQSELALRAALQQMKNETKSAERAAKAECVTLTARLDEEAVVLERVRNELREENQLAKSAFAQAVAATAMRDDLHAF